MFEQGDEGFNNALIDEEMGLDVEERRVFLSLRTLPPSRRVSCPKRLTCDRLFKLLPMWSPEQSGESGIEGWPLVVGSVEMENRGTIGCW